MSALVKTIASGYKLKAMLSSTIYQQFAAVAEERSFTAAAIRLNMAQASLSSRIKQFEKRLGFSLFLRNTRKVELTEQGRRLLPTAQAIARDIIEFNKVTSALLVDSELQS